MGQPHHRTLKPGDHVRLNGQGPVMTVIKYVEENDSGVHSNFIVQCHWFDETGEQTCDYHQQHLVRVTDNGESTNEAHYKVSHDKLIDPNDPTPGRN